MDTNPQHFALPAESVTITAVDPAYRYLVTVKVVDDMDSTELEQVVIDKFRALGVPAAHVQFLYTQGSGVLLTHEVKQEEQVKRSHRG